MAEVLDIDACFLSSLFTFSRICFWYSLGRQRDFFYLVYGRTQLGICDVYRDRGNNIWDCYMFIILRSVFFLFKIAKKLFFVHFAIRLSNKRYEDICVKNLEVCSKTIFVINMVRINKWKRTFKLRTHSSKILFIEFL